MQKILDHIKDVHRYYHSMKFFDICLVLSDSQVDILALYVTVNDMTQQLC